MSTRTKVWLGLGVVPLAGASVTDQPGSLGELFPTALAQIESGEGGEAGEGSD